MALRLHTHLKVRAVAFFLGFAGGGVAATLLFPTADDMPFLLRAVILCGLVVGGAYLAQLERSPEEPAELLVESAGELELLPGGDDERLARPRGEPVIPRVPERAFRTGLDTVRAEEALAEVDARRASDRDGSGRARLDAGLAPVGTLRWIDHRPTAKALGQGGRCCRRVAHRPVPLLDPSEDFPDHG